MIQILLSTVLGSFFIITGWHKTFVPSRREALRGTLEENGLPCGGFMCTWVSGWEILAGLLALAGAVLSLLGHAIGYWLMLAGMVPIIAILSVACWCEAVAKVASYEPLNKADWFQDLLYLPEVLMLVMAIGVVVA